MRYAGVLILLVAVSPPTLASFYPEPEALAFWLEQVPGTPDVLVVGGWAADRLQGWAWGVCHDPAAARVGDGEYSSCRCSDGCPGIECPHDILHAWLDREPAFNSHQILEAGVIQGVVIDFCPWCVLDARERFEMLRVSYNILAPPVRLEFCDTLGEPPVATVMVFGGASIQPAMQQGLILRSDNDFVRGDANADGAVDMSDAVFLLEHLLLERGTLSCRAAGDANADGRVDIADPVTLVGHLFRARGPLATPFPTCGNHEPGTAPPLDCLDFPPCR